MKFLISMLFVVLSLSSFSQSAKEIKFSKAKIADIKTLSDLISDIPKDCKVMTYVFSISFNGSLREFTCVSDGMSPELKTVLSRKEKGEWFFVENIKSGCEKSHNKNYKIILE